MSNQTQRVDRIVALAACITDTPHIASCMWPALREHDLLDPNHPRYAEASKAMNQLIDAWNKAHNGQLPNV